MDDILVLLMKAGAGVTLIIGIMGLVWVAVATLDALTERVVKSFKVKWLIIDYYRHRGEFKVWRERQEQPPSGTRRAAKQQHEEIE